MESDSSLSTSPMKDGQLDRNIAGIIDFLNSPPEEISDMVDSGTETSDCNEPTLDILKDVVAYAEVKSNEDNRSRMIGRELQRLGARVEKRFNKTVTHVIFYNGSEKTRQRAEKTGLHLVSVSWIQTCKVQGRRVPEVDFPAAKISPKMIGTKRKKCRSMQPIPLEEELARSKERCKRKMNKQNRWKILLEGEAYADYSPSYLSKLKPNPHLVPETPADKTITSKLTLAGNMAPLAEEEEYVSSVEESPISTAAIHKRLFDSDDSDNEGGLPPLWERVKKFTPSRQTDDSDTSCEINLPKVGRSPDHSPTKLSPGSSSPRSVPVSDHVSVEESVVVSKKGGRRSLGRRALLNSAKKAMQERADDGVNEGSKLSPLVTSSTEDMFDGKGLVTDNSATTPVAMVTSSSSESVVTNDEEKKPKRSRRRSSVAPKLTTLVEDSSSGSDVPARRRKLLRPGDDNLLNPSPSVTPKTRRVSETPPSVLTARDSLLKSSASESDVIKTKSRRKSLAVSSPSLEKEKPKPRRRSTASVPTPIVTEVKTKAKIRVPIPETTPMEVDEVEIPEKKRKRPKFSSSDSDTNPIKKETKKRKSKAQTTVAKDSEELPQTSHDGLDTTSNKTTKNILLDNCNITKNSDSTSETGPKKLKSDVKETSRSKLRSKHSSTEPAPPSGLKPTLTSSLSNENNKCSGSENHKEPRHNTKTLPGITLTNLHRDERSKIVSVIKKLGKYRITERVDESTTHVICGERRRTLNVLHAITRGCWLLGTEWVFKSLEKNKWIKETGYSLDDEFPSCKTSRSEKLRRGGVYRPDLFSDCGGILLHHQTAPPSHELQTLVQLCQGEIVSTSRNAKILVGRWRSATICVTEQWILDSVFSLKCQPFEPYLLRKDES